MEEFSTKTKAFRACELLRANINKNTGTPRTIGELVLHYRQKEMPEDGSKSFSTRTAYDTYLRNWIVPAWGEHSLSDVRTVAVEDWLRTLPLANGSRAKIRNLMSTQLVTRYVTSGLRKIRFASCVSQPNVSGRRMF